MKKLAFFAILIVSAVVIANCEEMDDEGDGAPFRKFQPKCPADRACSTKWKGCPESDTKAAKGSVCLNRKEKFDAACRRAVAQAEESCKAALNCTCSTEQCSVDQKVGKRERKVTCESYCDTKHKKCSAEVSVKTSVRVLPGEKGKRVCERVRDKKCPSNWRVNTREETKCVAQCSDQTCQCS